MVVVVKKGGDRHLRSALDPVHLNIRVGPSGHDALIEIGGTTPALTPSEKRSGRYGENRQ